MRRSKYVAVVALVAMLVAGTSAAASAIGRPGLPWKSPPKITSDVPVRVTSIVSCPAVPTPGDTVLVQITLSFGSAGSSADVFPVNPDRSWSGSVTFSFSGVTIRHTSITAQCLDFNGITAVPYAQYLVRNTQIFN